MQNFLFRHNGREYATLFGMNYMNMLVGDTSILPSGLIDAVRPTFMASAELDNINVTKSLNGKLVATATVRMQGNTYRLDTSNTEQPLTKIADATVPEQTLVEDIPEPPISHPQPISHHEPEPEPEPEPEQIPEPETEPAPLPKTEPAPLPKQAPVIVQESEPKQEPELVSQKYNPLFLRRVDAYTLVPISMDEVSQKGDAYCEMNGWSRFDQVYMIDDVVSVARLVHSDALNINMSIPYEEVANCGKN